jgi:hypothetical protein
VMFDCLLLKILDFFLHFLLGYSVLILQCKSFILYLIRHSNIILKSHLYLLLVFIILSKLHLETLNEISGFISESIDVNLYYGRKFDIHRISLVPRLVLALGEYLGEHLFLFFLSLLESF